MRVVIDTNIIFSAILNTKGSIGEILYNSGDQFEFYSPEFMLQEIKKFQPKLEKYSRMSSKELDISIQQVLKKIQLIAPEAISTQKWKLAFELTQDIDEDDTPFIATAIAINGIIWTGDKKLIKGLHKKGFMGISDTENLIKISKS